MAGYELILNFLAQQGPSAQVQHYQARAEEHYRKLMLARQERSFVRASDEFLAHGFSAETIQSLVEPLARYDQLREAYLVRKVVQYFPEDAFYVLAVRRQPKFWETSTEQADQQFLNQLANG